MALVFFRLFKTHKYRSEFLSGKLYLNDIRFFSHRFEGKTSISDIDEGASDRKKIKNVEIKLPNNQILNLDKGTLRFYPFDDAGHIFCIYSIEKRSLVKQDHSIPTSVLNDIGTYAVFITNPDAFLIRLKIGVWDKCKRINHGKINYVNDDYFGKWGAFKKSSKFSVENEYRIFIQFKDWDYEQPNPISIDIGPLWDICKVFKLEPGNSPRFSAEDSGISYFDFLRSLDYKHLTRELREKSLL